MNELTPQQTTELQRFRDLAYTKSQSRLWPKLENVLPFSTALPGGQKKFIPLIQNIQSNRLLTRLGQKAAEKMIVIEKPLPQTVGIATLLSVPKIAPPAPPPKTGFLEEIQFYQEQLNKLTAQNQKLHEQMGGLKNQMTNLQQQHTRVSREQMEEAGVLEKQEEGVQGLKKNLEESEKVSGELKERLQQKEGELTNLQKASSEQYTRLEILQSEKKAAEAMVKNLKAALSNLRTKPPADEGVQELQERLGTKEKELQEKERELTSLHAQLKDAVSLSQEIGNLKRQIEELSSHKEKLNRVCQEEELKLESLRGRVLQLKKSNQEQRLVVDAQEKALENLANEKLKLVTFIDDLVQKLKSAESQKKVEEIIQLELPRLSEEIPSVPPGKIMAKAIKLPVKVKKLPRLTNLFNAINGVVMDNQGNPLLGAVVIIRGENEQPLRALKTNELGQFMVTSPLRNGRYLIEIDKEGLKFDILGIELKGSVLPPIEIFAHAQVI